MKLLICLIVLQNARKYLLNIYSLDAHNVYKFLLSNIETPVLDLNLSRKILSIIYQDRYTDESIFILSNIKIFCREMNNFLNEGKLSMTPRKDSFIQLIENLEKIDIAYEESFDKERIAILYEDLEKNLQNAQIFISELQLN